MEITLGKVCLPLQHNISGPLQVRYAKRFNITTKYPISQFLTSLDHDISTKKSFLVPCKIFDHVGFYRFSLESSFEDDWPRIILAFSKDVNVTLNSEYSLSTGAQSTLPCKDPGIVVFFHYPQCILANDRIRLFGQRRLQGQLNVPPFMAHQYISETRVTKGHNMATFPCKDFKNASSMIYCFKYVSVSSLGAVSELRTVCLNAKQSSGMFYSDSWSQWSTWSPCTLTCGSNGVRMRHRFCESSVHGKEGMFCDGESIQSQKCEYTQCEGHEEKPLSIVDTVPVMPRCRCGCEMNLTFLVLASSGHYCSGISTWTFVAPEEARIRLQFTYVKLNTSFEWITIRNGKLPTSDLLGQSDMAKKFEVLQSTSDEVVVQFRTMNNANIGEGFVLKIWILMSDFTMLNPETLEMKKKFTSNSVHMVGLAICASLFITAAMYALFQRLNCQKFTKYRQKGVPSYNHSFQDIQLLTPERTTLLSYVSDASENSEILEPLVQRSANHPKHFSNSVDSRQLSIQREAFPESRIETASKKVRLKKQMEKIADIPLKRVQPSQTQKGIDKSQRGKRLPVATVSPQPARAWLKKNLAKQIEETETTEFTDKCSYDNGGKMKEVLMSNEETISINKIDEHQKLDLQDAETTAQQTKSVNLQYIDNNVAQHDRTEPPAKNDSVQQEEIMSGTGETENDFEYDYYDYNVHYDPGSVFSREASIVSWLPPFIPRLSARNQTPEND